MAQPDLSEQSLTQVIEVPVSNELLRRLDQRARQDPGEIVQRLCAVCWSGS